MSELGIVVNYYWPDPEKEGHNLIVLTTHLALLYLVENPAVNTVVMADGSPNEDKTMKKICEDIGVKYLHAGKRLSLAEGYNMGWRALSEPYVGLMQNDILPHPPQSLELLLEWIKRPDVGCVFPYLGDPANYTQFIELFNRCNRTCEPSNMQLNLNIFKREILEEVGGVHEGFQTSFYDPILVIQTRKLGYRVVMVGGAKAIHVDQLTKKLGGSSLTYDRWKKDAEKWETDFKEYSYEDEMLEKMNYGVWPLSTTKLAKFLWNICYSLPNKKMQFSFWRFLMWFEPFITNYPAKYGAKKFE